MHAWNKQKKSENESKSTNIKSDFKSSPDEASAHLNNTPPMKVTPIIGSNADSSKDIDTGQAYRGWRYAQIKTQLKLDGAINMICADSETSITMMDRKLKKRDLPDAHTHLMTVPARVRGIENDIHETNEYIIHEIYLPDGKDKDERAVTAKTTPREIHLVDGLAADMLLRNDILVPEEIDLLFSKEIAHIGSCDVNIPIEVHSKEPLMRRVINSKKASIIPPHSNATVTIHHLNLPDRDFLFEPREDSILSLYAGLINKNTEAILVKNDSDKPVKIQRNMKLDNLSNLTIDDYYHVTSGQENIAKLTTRHPKKEHHQMFAKGLFKKLISAGKKAAIALLATQATTMHVTNDLTPSINAPALAPTIEVIATPQDTVLPNEVTIYNNVPELVQVVKEYPSVWTEEGFAEIPECE